MTCGKGGGLGKHGSPPQTTTSKLLLNYRITIRNQVEWKSDNYGIKENTSIQTGRRGRDLEGLAPYPHVVAKMSGGISWE